MYNKYKNTRILRLGRAARVRPCDGASLDGVRVHGAVILRVSYTVLLCGGGGGGDTQPPPSDCIRGRVSA